jgi:DNA damage-inducible protein 1
MSTTIESQKEMEMQKRLRMNPMDEEANAYFGEKIRKQNVQDQYYRMMEEFPESMGRVLMLYIDAKVNNHPIQAFVDSGAQMSMSVCYCFFVEVCVIYLYVTKTSFLLFYFQYIVAIMSSKCAEQCGILHFLDDRFAGMAVGVGTGKILGRIHIAQVQIADHYFPCTITIMDSEEGLGDKNMDFLLGLDMLKRHRCNIDLVKNALVFRVGDNTFETKFLHEKDLDESKGGTRGFDADKTNEEIEKMEEELDSKN